MSTSARWEQRGGGGHTLLVANDGFRGDGGRGGFCDHVATATRRTQPSRHTSMDMEEEKRMSDEFLIAELGVKQSCWVGGCGVEAVVEACCMRSSLPLRPSAPLLPSAACCVIRRAERGGSGGSAHNAKWIGFTDPRDEEEIHVRGPETREGVIT